MRVTTLVPDAQSNVAGGEATECERNFAAYRRRFLMAVTSIVVLLFAHNAAFAAGASREYQLKAAFLYNICKFVEWPSERFVDASSPLVIGVFGIDSFDGELEEMVKDRKVNGRSVVIKFVTTVKAARTTHVLFIAASESARFMAIRPQLADSAILTVGESRMFLDDGGVFSFEPVGDKLSFEINMDSAKRAHLKISSQLQKLATSVRSEP